jgi:hypothetical protein
MAKGLVTDRICTHRLTSQLQCTKKYELQTQFNICIACALLIPLLAEGFVLSVRDKWSGIRFVFDGLFNGAFDMYQPVEGRMMKSFMNSELEGT